MVIILLILITLSLDSVWILLGENCCWSLLALKGLSQLHKQFVSPISLVQFNWYCKRRGDNDEELTRGRNLINIYFSFSLSALVLALHARSHALADVFEKNEKKIKQRPCTG